MNRWQLTEEVKVKFEPIVKEFINHIEAEEFSDKNLKLSGTELNPYTLWKLLEDLGYEKTDFDTNGWELDFWIYFKKEGFKTLVITGTGITFELALCVRED